MWSLYWNGAQVLSEVALTPNENWGHDDVIKCKHFPRYWSFVRGIHRSPVNSPHKGQWRGALMFSLICVWINGWVNNREAVDLRRYPAHYDVTVMGLEWICDTVDVAVDWLRCFRHDLSRVWVILGTSCLGCDSIWVCPRHEMSCVQVGLHASCPGYNLSWVRFFKHVNWHKISIQLCSGIFITRVKVRSFHTLTFVIWH